MTGVQTCALPICEIVASLKDEGKTVFLSSHQLADVELICSRVAIIHRGKLLTTGTIKDLTAGGRIEIVAEGAQLVNGTLAKLQAIIPDTHEEANHTVRLITEDNNRVSAAIDAIRAASGNIISIVPIKKSLEDVFVETVRKEEGL